MTGIYVTAPRLELETACPVNVAWHSSSKAVSVDQPVTDPAFVSALKDQESQRTVSYVQRRYWETLYLPECLAPVKYLCSDLLRIRRNPPLQDSASGDGIAATASNAPSTAPEKDDGFQTSLQNRPQHDEPIDEIAGNDNRPLTSSPHHKKRKLQRDEPTWDTLNLNANQLTTPLDLLLMPIAKIELKHRKAVSAVLFEKHSEIYGLEVHLEVQAETSISPDENKMIGEAIRLHNTSARADEQRTATLRAIHADVEHWYQESKMNEARPDEKPESKVAERQTHHTLGVITADVTYNAQAMDIEKKLLRRQEMLKSHVDSEVRKLREHFERREVLLQIVLLLVRNHLYPPPARPKVIADEDEAREVDPDPEADSAIRKRKKKSRTDSFSATEKASRRIEPQGRRKRKSSRRQFNGNDEDMQDGTQVAIDPEDLLDMLADRIALWHAVGAGSERPTGASAGHQFHADGREYDLDSDSDEELSFARNREVNSYTRPDRRAMEEWDWVQRFCVNIVEKYFLRINRAFCESLHLKVFGEALAAAESPNMQNGSSEIDRDDASNHSLNSGNFGEVPRRPFSRAPSIVSLSSSTRIERTVSADPTISEILDRPVGGPDDSRGSAKPGMQKTASSNSLSRTTSSTSSSHLFKNRQVGFSRTNSSMLAANSSGPVSILMGKRKTMVVPLGNRSTTTRKVSGESSAALRHATVPERQAVTGNATLALATPARPRSKASQSRDLYMHRRQSALGKMASISDCTASSSVFVAETPMMPAGRHQDFGSRLTGVASQASAALSYRLHGEADDADDLADFMVDTDEEEDGALFSGGHTRASDLVGEWRNDRQLVDDVSEVPETPLKGVI